MVLRNSTEPVLKFEPTFVYEVGFLLPEYFSHYNSETQTRSGTRGLAPGPITPEENTYNEHENQSTRLDRGRLA